MGQEAPGFLEAMELVKREVVEVLRVMVSLAAWRISKPSRGEANTSLALGSI
jgi:hypothetical protein